MPTISVNPLHEPDKSGDVFSDIEIGPDGHWMWTHKADEALHPLELPLPPDADGLPGNLLITFSNMPPEMAAALRKQIMEGKVDFTQGDGYISVEPKHEDRK